MIWPLGNRPIRTFLARRRALRELQQIIAVDSAHVALQGINPLTTAKQLLDSGDLEGAREYLASARHRMPEYTAANPVTVDILLGLGDDAETESFILDGMRRFPRQPHFLEGYAMAAERKREFAEAAKRWARVRRKFPMRKTAFIHAADCLCELGRWDEADSLISRALRRFRDDLGVLHCYARISESRGDSTEAYRRWSSFQDRHMVGLVGAAGALHKLGRIPEAVQLLAEGRARYPLERAIPTMQARIAEATGDKDAALQHWAGIRQRFPLDPVGYVEGLRYLREQREWDAADTLAQAAIDRFPTKPWPLLEYAWLAHFRRDWPEAATRWAALRAVFPDQKDARQREAEALAAAGTAVAPTGDAQPKAHSTG